VIEIAVYVEGGGDKTATQEELRRGFDALFVTQRCKAREKRGSLRFICCGGRDQAYKAFKNALEVNCQRTNVLLVDSETSIDPVPTNKAKDGEIRIAHLRQRAGTEGRGQGDGWVLSDAVAAQIHLMVQCMEAWIVADPETLEEFYKPNFKKDKLPKRPNLEEESKPDIYAKLEMATEVTQQDKSNKGKYGKIKHASKLLQMIRPDKVAARCPRFRIFRDWLNQSIENPSDED
jgi:hypothetical protein